jgi:Zn-dependent M28 family amino/carboxypeptidase
VRIPGRPTVALLAILAAATLTLAGQGPPISTPLPPGVLALLANEISGQFVFNNQVRLAGAPWQRDASEFSDTLFETRTIADLLKGYGIETTRIERSPGTRTIQYPAEGELWQLEPDRRLIARLGADAALVAGGSQTAEVTGPLVYIPPTSADGLKTLLAAGPPARYKGAIALMWSHPRDEAAALLDQAGLQGVIAFSSRDRYLDPNQVVYSSGSYSGTASLKVGMTVSWRQWSEFFEDITAGRAVTLRARTKIDTYPDKFEAIYSWIPGTEPDAKGVIFTAHLFEGYVKRGANDNMSGVVVQIEILRALQRLIASGQLPRPRRTISFLWPNEISGTYEYIKQHPGFPDRLSININMDMVGEALRRNNSAFTMSETPDYLPSYLDGLADSVMRYVWRMNDIVYLPDAPRARPGGQFFPMPIWEKNGSTDAFRYFTHRATGGSDHICFNNPSVAVPAVELFTWPDQWYHADTDNPDKSDPTQMKRVAFIGAAAAWAAANCTDDVLPGLIEATSAFGYRRLAERDLSRALGSLDKTDAAGLAAAAAKAAVTLDWAVDRETGALKSIEDVYTASAGAKTLLTNRLTQWALYRAALRGQLDGYAKLRAAQLGLKTMPVPVIDPLEKRYAAVVPAIDPGVKGREFSLQANERYAAHLKANPDTLRALGLTPPLASAVLNYVNGRRSIVAIRNAVVAETGQDVSLAAVAGYLDVLKTVKWVAY